MKPSNNSEQILRHLPRGRTLPPTFDDFVRAEPPFRIEWNDLDAYGLKPTALKEVTPFLRLPDGALIALWYCADEPAVVLIGGHGELEAVAINFDDFLKAVNAKTTGLPDIDELAKDFVVPGFRGRRSKARLPALTRQLEKWFKQNTSLLEPDDSSQGESVRKRVLGVAKAMLCDGLSKVYTQSSDWWTMDFKIERRDGGLSLTYLDFGNWYPVPGKYALTPVAADVLKLVKNKRRRLYELSASCAGIVSVNRDRDLVLVPPKKPSRTN